MSKTLEKAIEILRSREEVGKKKYGRTLDDCPDSHYDFKTEMIEELLDGLMYASREIIRLEKQITEYKYNRNLKEMTGEK